MGVYDCDNYNDLMARIDKVKPIIRQLTPPTQTSGISDTISRKAAIDAVSRGCWEFRGIFAECEKNLNELPSVQPEQNGWVHIDDIYRLISGHSNYHGDNILAALTCLAEGKEVLKPIIVLDAQPERKPGKWEIYVISMLDGEGCRCSECGFEGAPYWDFCPNCGARMEDKE